jgi:succinate dehydrogenase / fumarate reductase iron-sulfur subunit
MSVRFQVRRFDPERDRAPHWETYDVPVAPTDRVLDGLHYIKWHMDGTLTLRRSCAHGICGSDAMMINGRNRLACKVLIRDCGRLVRVEPVRGMRVIKDLVVDMEPFFAQYRSVLPYLINDEPAPERERLQSPADRQRFDDSTKCILCACCTTACPIFWADGAYVGPAAIVNAHRFIFDSRDQGAAERLAILAETSGVFRCKTTFNCTDACPRAIDVTRAIQDVKRAIVAKQL